MHALELAGPVLFLSTLSLRRATAPNRHPYPRNKISIHALLAESDHETTPCKVGETQISIHALLAESDYILCVVSIQIGGFLSTLSLRRATGNRCFSFCLGCHFYPRSPCGERRPLIFSVQPRKTISIHALLAESDCSGSQHPAGTTNFYPRSPCGERPQAGKHVRQPKQFLSTLSLRRATISCAWSASKLGDFYPRSPCGERL